MGDQQARCGGCSAHTMRWLAVLLVHLCVCSAVEVSMLGLADLDDGLVVQDSKGKGGAKLSGKPKGKGAALVAASQLDMVKGKYKEEKLKADEVHKLLDKQRNEVQKVRLKEVGLDNALSQAESETVNAKNQAKAAASRAKAAEGELKKSSNKLKKMEEEGKRAKRVATRAKDAYTKASKAFTKHAKSPKVSKLSWKYRKLAATQAQQKEAMESSKASLKKALE